MTPANWRAHPHAPWAFANVERFLPTARVRKGRVARPLNPGAALPMLSFAGSTGEPVSLLTFLRDTHADGFIVLHRGEIVYEHYSAATFAVTRHLCFSITKAFTGLLAELLMHRGLISGTTKVGRIVPELAQSAFARASLRALLDMRDGVPFNEDYGDPDAQIHSYSRHFWGAGEGGVVAALATFEGARSRGAPFLYRTPVTDVVGLMLERAAGCTLPNLAGALWEHVGSANDARWVQDTGGRAIASAGLACTLRDLARLGLAIGEVARGTGPANWRASAASILKGGDRAAFAAAGHATRPGWSYRSGWWIDHESKAANAIGVFGQRLHVAPEDEVVIARFGSHPVAGNHTTDEAHALASAAIRAALRDG
jgi:CubicO group peptidase (beta-lactamase class C family)